MADHFTFDYVKSMAHEPIFKVKRMNGRVEKAGFFDEYVRRYGEDSLSLQGFPQHALILELAYSAPLAVKNIVYFSRKEDADAVLADFGAKAPLQMRRKNLEVLLQFDKIVGIAKLEEAMVPSS